MYLYFKSNYRKAPLFFVILLVVYNLACAPSLPSQSDAQRVLQNIAQKKMAGIYSVRRVTKTNATATEGKYVLEFEAEIECQKVNALPPPRPGEFRGGGLLSQGIPELNVTCSNVGEIQHFKGQMTFQKTENGWRGEDGEVY